MIFTVTDLTKVIDGVRTLVAWDRDYNDGQLVEPELVFFAQDNDGHVWTLGQYPEEYEDGELVKTPAWIAGLQGAKAGLVMRAQPRMRTSDYSQGLGPKVEYADRAKVHKTGQETCVAFGCYRDVLVTEEWDAAVLRVREDAPDGGRRRGGPVHPRMGRAHPVRVLGHTPEHLAGGHRHPRPRGQGREGRHHAVVRRQHRRARARALRREGPGRLLLAPPGDADRLGRALARLGVERALRDAVGSQNRERVRALFGLDRMLDESVRVIVEALSASRRAGLSLAVTETPPR